MQDRYACPFTRNRHWHDLLEGLLEQGEPEMIDGITSTLRWAGNSPAKRARLNEHQLIELQPQCQDSDLEE